MRKLEIEVNKKGASGKYEPVGKVDIFCPTLEEFGLTAEVAVDKDGAAMEEDGLPVYKADAINWLQGAVLAAVKAQARNRLVSGTATLKDGAAIADTLEALIAEGERGAGSAAALAAIRELKTKFGAYVAGLGKSAAAQTLLTTLFGNKTALAMQSEANKQKMAGYISSFAETLEAEALASGQRYLQSLLDNCEGVVEAEDF